jgi:hypothetical protein
MPSNAITIRIAEPRVPFLPLGAFLSRINIRGSGLFYGLKS